MKIDRSHHFQNTDIAPTNFNNETPRYSVSRRATLAGIGLSLALLHAAGQ